MSMEHWHWDVQLSSINDAKVAQFPSGIINRHTGVFVSVAEIGGGMCPFKGMR